MGMKAIQWDVDSLDWKGISADEIAKRVTGKVQCGSIILFHNAGEHTPEALPAILDYLLGEGYTLEIRGRAGLGLNRMLVTARITGITVKAA